MPRLIPGLQQNTYCSCPLLSDSQPNMSCRTSPIIFLHPTPPTIQSLTLASIPLEKLVLQARETFRLTSDLSLSFSTFKFNPFSHSQLCSRPLFFSASSLFLFPSPLENTDIPLQHFFPTHHFIPVTKSSKHFQVTHKIFLPGKKVF